MLAINHRWFLSGVAVGLMIVVGLLVVIGAVIIEAIRDEYLR
jgi:hypothetical protein